MTPATNAYVYVESDGNGRRSLAVLVHAWNDDGAPMVAGDQSLVRADVRFEGREWSLMENKVSSIVAAPPGALVSGERVLAIGYGADDSAWALIGSDGWQKLDFDTPCLEWMDE